MAKLKPKHQETFEAGIYEVEGIERWISTDSSGTPIWVDQKWGDDFVLVARYSTYKEIDGIKGEGPPGSLQPKDLALFVAAFGGDPTRLPDDLATTKALLIAEEEINNSDKVVKVKVGDSGWVSSVYDAYLPKGLYAFKFNGLAPRKNGSPYWRENKRFHTESTVANLRVIGEVKDGEIVDTPFNGVEQDAWLTRTALYVLRALIPNVYEAMLGEEDEELTKIEKMAKEEDVVILGRVDFRNENDNTPKLIRSSLEAYFSDKPLPSEPSVSPLAILRKVIEERTEGVAFDKGELTLEGKEWCKDNLKELCEENSIPKEFDRMADEEIIFLLKALGAEEEVEEIDSVDEPW